MPGVSVLSSTSSSDLGSFAVVAGAGSCRVAASQPILPVWTEMYKPVFDRKVKDSPMVPLPVSDAGPTNAQITGLMRNKIFGSINSSSGVAAQKFKLKQRFRSHRSMKEFRQSAMTGEILISPMENVDVSVTVLPSLPKLTAVRGADFSVLHTVDLPGFPTLEPTGCSQHPMGLPIPFGYRARHVSAAPLCGVSRFNWYYGGNTVLPLSGAEATEMAGLITYFVNQTERDEGIVTSTLCAARAGILDLSTTIAEAPETVRSIWAACKFILQAYLECRRNVGRLNNSKDPGAIEAIATLWLQYRYAIMPNVYLIEDSLDYLAKGERVYQTERGGTSRSTEPHEINGWVIPPIEIVDRVFVKNRFGVGFLNPTLQNNLAVTAWELVPLSFVIDWVLNIGDLLGSLSPATGSVQEVVQYSRRTNISVSLSHPDWIGAPVRVDINNYKSVGIDNVYEEIGIVADPSMSLKRWLDAGALSWLSFKGLFKSALRSTR